MICAIRPVYAHTHRIANRSRTISLGKHTVSSKNIYVHIATIYICTYRGNRKITYSRITVYYIGLAADPDDHNTP